MVNVLAVHAPRSGQVRVLAPVLGVASYTPAVKLLLARAVLV